MAAPLVFAHAPPPELGCRHYEVAMVGDLMVHGEQLRTARQRDGTYSFAGYFDEVAPFLAGADLALANFETVTAGAKLGFTGFPQFNSPDTYLDAIAAGGFDALQTANNHCLDRRRVGLHATLDQIEARGLRHTGTYRTLADATVPWVLLEIPDGPVVAFVAYTFSTNNIDRPAGEPWSVAMIDPDAMAQDIAGARAAGADLVIVGVHWGIEYSQRPDPADVATAAALVAAGADIVMGSHPHVQQPAAVLAGTDAFGDPKDALVLYSLGNFMSNQRIFPRDMGVVARASVRWCHDDRPAVVDRVAFTPTWVDTRDLEGHRAFRAVPADPTRCVAAALSPQDCAQVEAVLRHAEEVFPAPAIDWVPGGLGDAGLEAGPRCEDW